jgi:hypothetical protein
MNVGTYIYVPAASTLSKKAVLCDICSKVGRRLVSDWHAMLFIKEGWSLQNLFKGDQLTCDDWHVPLVV